MAQEHFAVACNRELGRLYGDKTDDVGIQRNRKAIFPAVTTSMCEEAAGNIV